MSNDLQIIDLVGGSAMTAPTFLQGATSVVGAISQRQAANRISLDGKLFKFMRGGVLEHTGQYNSIDFIIVGDSKVVSRMFFDSVYKGSGSASAPTCYSQDGNTPGPNVTAKQSENCQSCPQNAVGSSRTGDGRACGFLRRLVVMPIEYNQAGENIYQWETYVLDLKSKSLWSDVAPPQFSYTDYGKKLKANHVYPDHIITRATFDPNQSAPVLQFQALRYIEEEEFTRSNEAARDSNTVEMLSIDGGVIPAPPAAAPVPVAAPIPVPPRPAAAPVAVAAPTPIRPQAPAPAAPAPRAAPTPVAARPAPMPRPAPAPAAAPAPQQAATMAPPSATDLDNLLAELG